MVYQKQEMETSLLSSGPTLPLSPQPQELRGALQTIDTALESIRWNQASATLPLSSEAYMALHGNHQEALRLIEQVDRTLNTLFDSYFIDANSMFEYLQLQQLLTVQWKQLQLYIEELGRLSQPSVPVIPR